MLAQTPGFNYQALILNNQQIQIPGTDISSPNEPLASENISLRFTITNESQIEYIEEHTIITDENGMVSLIVGEGTPISFTFGNINWDGKLKYLKVELNIINNNDGFLLLDTQKILYIPHSTGENNPVTGYGNVKIVNSLNELIPPYNFGDLVWVKNYGTNKNTTLVIWEGNNWEPVNEDYDATNELGFTVVENNIARDLEYPNPKTGDRVWNKSYKCIQIFDGFWVSITTQASNGLSKNGDTLKLGGVLTESTKITTDATNTLAIKGLQSSIKNDDDIIVIDKNTGVLKKTSLATITSDTQIKEIIIYAIDGQLEFPTPLDISSTEKINVFRNGINISFTAINNRTIKLEPEAICYKNDKIRIVQLQ